MTQISSFVSRGGMSLAAAILTALGVLLPFTSVGQWSLDPKINKAIAVTPQLEYYPQIVTDGKGGVIIVWYNSDRYIYAQRIDATGRELWTPNGVIVSRAIGIDLVLPEANEVVTDQFGGAIITWQDNRSDTGSDIYAQHIDSAGVGQWGHDGIGICTAAGNQSIPTLVSDGKGGAIITWTVFGIERNYDIYARRVDRSGVMQWLTNGVPISTAPGDQSFSTIATDGAEGAIITWQDGRDSTTNNYNVYAQRIDSSGAVLWTTNGLPITSVQHERFYPKIVSDGVGGAIIIWEEVRINSNPGIYAQRISAAGVVQWIPEGIPTSAAAAAQGFYQAIGDGGGGMIIAWDDFRTSFTRHIYAQHLGAAGDFLWSTNDVAVCLAGIGQSHPQITDDGAGGATITWEDFRNSSYLDIYAQRINAAGRARWARDGLAISIAQNTQEYPVITSNGMGGAVITWMDRRNDSIDSAKINIYAQYVGENGYQTVHDKWNLVSVPFTSNNQSKTHLFPTAISDAFTFQGDYVGQDTLRAGFGYWLKFVGDQYISLPGSFRTEDTINIVEGWNLIGSISSPVDVKSIRSIPPSIVTSNFFGYDKRYHVSDTVNPTKGYWVKSSQIGKLLLSSHETSLSGRIRIVPTSELPPSSPEVAATLQKERPNNFSLAQNYPNPFNPSTILLYDLPTDNFVELSIYNSLGQQVTMLVREWQLAGNYTVNWDAKDFPSGVYIYRLRAGLFSQTKKLLLMK